VSAENYSGIFQKKSQSFEVILICFCFRINEYIQPQAIHSPIQKGARAEKRAEEKIIYAPI